MSRAVMQKALDALESFQKISEFTPALAVHAIADLRAELAKPEQEPVLFIHPSTLEMASAHVGAWKPGHELPGYIALYTSPPQHQPIRREQRMCPNTYYECGRGCGDGPCKDFDAAYDIKEQS